MISEKDADIKVVHQEVYELQSRLKVQEKDSGDVMTRLTKELQDAITKHTELQHNIDEYNKKNEKINNDAQNNFNTKIQIVEKENVEEIRETNVVIKEKNENLEKMNDEKNKKLRYDLELMVMQQDCASLEKTIQQEKYQIEIEMARMKKEKKSEFENELKLQQQMAKEDAQRNIQGIERKIHSENQTLTEKTIG